MKKIKITKDLRIGYEDLMKEVDWSQKFTLMDILRVCIKGLIPVDVLSSILRCPYLVDFWDESSKKNDKKDRELDYLEIYWWGTKSSDNGVREDGNAWCFHGIGKKGYVPKDILEHYKISAKEKREYRQPIAVEFTPLYALAKLPIRLRSSLCITDYDADIKDENFDQKIDFQPSIKLIELLYAIFWELSFCGSPKQRDEKTKELQRRCDELDRASKEGRLDEITIPHEKVKKLLEKKIKCIKKNSKR